MIKRFIKKQVYKYFTSYYYLKSYKNKFLTLLYYLKKKGSTFIYNFNNKKIFFSINDFHSYEIFFCSYPKIEEKFLIRLIDYFIRESNIKHVLDVGANLGFYSLLLSNIRNSIVYSIEPFEDTFKILEQNININKSKNIFPKKQGITSKKLEGIIEIDKTINLPSNSTNLFKKNNLIGDKIISQKIETISLENFCIKNRLNTVDFIKLDVEGLEYQIFTDIDFVLKKYKPMFYVEIHKTENFLMSYPIKKLLENEYDVYLFNQTNTKYNSDKYNFFGGNYYKKVNLNDKYFFNQIESFNNIKIFALNNKNNFNIKINSILNG